MSPKAFSEAIRNARQLFDYARENFGLKFHLLDLGGGYPGSSDSGDFFSLISREINTALDTYFPADLFAQLNGTSDENKFKIIAEPGRYYACSAFTLCVNVIAKRVMNQSPAQQKLDREAFGQNESVDVSALDTSKSIMYYINDGVYASFNCLFYDHAECLPILIQDHSDSSKFYKSSIWGPTCDGLDVVVKECLLPELKTDEFMVFKNMGAYTLSGAVAFNGIPLARCIYVASTSWDTIKNAFDDAIIDDSGVVSAAPSSLPSTMMMAAGAATSCAAAAHFHARSMSLQLDDLHLSGVLGGDDSCAGSSDEADLSKDNHLIGEVGVVAETKDELDVDCAITC